MPKLLPFRLLPWFRTRVWGVRDLSPWYDYAVGEEPIGEVWLSGDDCIVGSGPLTGASLASVFSLQREELLGPGAAHEARFPLLMKVLFPQEKLSVQVHPDDAMARQKGEPHGKTECWYALEAAPGAKVALGLRAGTSQQEVQVAIQQKRLEELLNWVPVAKGDMIFVEAGTVHAIAPGLVLLETQQNSDMTYRLYDYGRPRELHLEEGLRAMRLLTNAGKVEPRVNDNKTLLIQSQYFRVDRFMLPVPAVAHSFALRTQRDSAWGVVQLVFVASGSGELHAAGCEPIALRRGELAVIPACVTEWQMVPTTPMEILRTIPQ
ncbi:MAG: type I phosphomannose isomerase catalytic subunit [Acidobacteriaceae bacterium]